MLQIPGQKAGQSLGTFDSFAISRQAGIFGGVLEPVLLLALFFWHSVFGAGHRDRAPSFKLV